jgi:homoserine dehydrogenase
LLVKIWDLVLDPRIHIIIEAISESNHLEVLTTALLNGKHVITANKKLVANSYDDLVNTAIENNVGFSYEATVGSGIPIINLIKSQVDVQAINKITGVLNGTCNYILNELENGKNFEEAVSLAIINGFAEKDPAADIHGNDTAYKILILSKVLGIDISVDKIVINGIQQLKDPDYNNNPDSNKRYKLLGELNAIDKRIRVFPKLVGLNSPFYNLNNEENGILIEGESTGTLFIKGKGAGKYPTANAIIQDLIGTIKDRIVINRPILNLGEVRV